MGWVTAVGAFIFGLATLVGGVSWINQNKKELFSWLTAVSGFFFLVNTTFMIAPVELSVGLPRTSISNGVHKVAFVYAAGENVNVGIEKKDHERERLYLYQFPKSTFDGEPNSEAKTLTVVKSGGFRKLVLK